MKNFNIKGFIIVLTLNSLLLENVKGYPNIPQMICVHKIKAYYKIKPNETPLPLAYAVYGMKYIRISEGTLSGIKIIPSDFGKVENTLKISEGQTSRGVPERVNNLNDLIGNLIANTADNNVYEGIADNNVYEGNYSQEGPSESEIPEKIELDYFKIPEDVLKYYLAFIPHLTNKTYFFMPKDYCKKNANKEDYVPCTRQILESFPITDNHTHKEIVLLIYQHYVIGELFSKSQEYAIEYLLYVTANFKLDTIRERGKMLSPGHYCQNQYPAKS